MLNYQKPFRSLTLGLAICGGLIALVQPASATQFKKLVETGQVLPGTTQPVATLSEASIGRDGQAVINIQTPFVRNTAGRKSGDQFFGIYSITKGGKISLLSQGSKVVDVQGSIDYKGLLSPSISEGVIAYTTYDLYEPYTNPGQIYTAKSSLNVGVPGAVKNYGSIVSGFSTSKNPRVSFANGLAYVLESSIVLSEPRPPIPRPTIRLKVLDTRASNPAFTILVADNNIQGIRSGSQGVAMLTMTPEKVYKLFERPNAPNGQFVQLNPQGQNPGSCGFAVSYESIVSCSVAGTQSVLSARFGKQSSFVTLPLPNPATLKSVSDPSISNNKILFKTTEQVADGPIVERIYVSRNTQVPKLILSSGEQLDGKVITGLKLGDNGRSIAGNYVVFTATFSDGSQALYRADL